MNKQNIGKSILIVIEALILCVVLVLGILTMTMEGANQLISNNRPSQGIIGKETESEKDTSGTEETIEYTEVRLTFSEEVESKLSSMTTEEKVAQLFLVTAESLTGVDVVTISGNGTKTALNQYPVGGLVYDGDNFMGPEQVQLLTGNAQDYSMERIGLPLFIAVEEEGGVNYSPLATTNLYDITLSPGELATMGDATLVTDAVNSRMDYLTLNGFNMVFGPMANLAAGADLNLEGRTYGSDAATASVLLAADVAASNAKDMLGVLRYFPRYGDAGDFSEITEDELNVFRAGIEAGAKVIMVSNGKAASITGEDGLPCSLAAGTVSKLRGEMGYEGVLITAPQNEEKITSGYSVGDAAVKAIVAGMDMIYEPANFTESYGAVLEAVNNGTISQMRLENAVGRILEMKID